MPEGQECSHPHEKSTFLFHHMTPNVDDRVNLSVACCVFRCMVCGGLYQKALIISRGYGQDGSIPKEFEESLEKIKEKKTLEAAVNQKVNSEVARILTERKMKNAGSQHGQGAEGVSGNGQQTQQGQPGKGSGHLRPAEAPKVDAPG